MHRHRAQSTLEFTIIFVIMAGLLFGLLAVWKNWCNQIMIRQSDFEESRVAAGSS